MKVISFTPVQKEFEPIAIQIVFESKMEVLDWLDYINRKVTIQPKSVQEFFGMITEQLEKQAEKQNLL